MKRQVNNLSLELKVSMEKLRETAELMNKEFKDINSARLDPDESHTIYSLPVTDLEVLHDGVTLAEGGLPGRRATNNAVPRGA